MAARVIADADLDAKQVGGRFTGDSGGTMMAAGHTE